VGVDKEWVYSGNRYSSTYTDVDPGRYVFRVKGSNNDGVWNQAGTSLIILIHPPFWKTWWFYSLSGLTFVALLSAGFRYRIAQVRKEERLLRKEESLLREQEQQKADFNKKLSEMEMQALRAQMNPHFIFNSLNSINRFILKNEAEAASDYLSKFSRLIRLILQNSNAPTVTLENELEALGLYLEMEALRFDNKFTFRIHCDQEVETEYIEIPPLIIQPYVENAIWHGLMHKQEGGHINIEIGQNEAMLLCSIEDDGVGRKRAGELKSKSATKKKSLGMQITAHRLELLNQVQGKQTTVEIVDLVDPGGEPCGTRVVLQIPV
jgi:LytS/YehU family sensor histidine kinase